MTLMAKVLVVISWYLFATICQSLNAGDYTSKLSQEIQLRADHDVVRNEVLNWTCPAEHSAGNLSKSQEWNLFLNSLYCKFSEYEIQKSKRKFDVSDIENWGKTNASTEDLLTGISNDGEISNNEQGIVIRKDNFRRFLDKIEQFNVTGMEKIRNIHIEEQQLEELNHILNLTIKEGFHISCKESHMFVKGNYIIMSHVNKIILTGAIGEKCKKLFGANRLKFLNIFALNTVFFDADMTAIGTLKNLTVIAPKWQIIGARMVDFRGQNGKPLGLRMWNNLMLHDGADGRPGMPGGPGGNFFGIAKEVLNGENLQILVNGGIGGPGENGGNGMKGRDGTTPTQPTEYVNCDRNLCANDKRINMSECNELKCDKIRGMNGESETSCDYKIFGEDGKIGGNGGNGGKGGKGGYPGEIYLIELNSSSKISQLHNYGQNGIDGRGGIGGYGGKHRGDIVVHCHQYCFAGCSWPKWTLKNSTYATGSVLSGKNGLEGANSKNILEPQAASTINKIDKAKIINEYKSYLRENLNDRFRYYFLIKFLNQLESNNNVKSVYDTSGFADELRSLEEQFNMLIKNIDLRPFYQSLLNRISEYALNATKNVDSISYKKVLGYLYTTTLGRLHNIDDDLESNLIIDISKFLDSVIKDVEKLKDSQNSKIKEEVINDYKQEYKKGIDAKIKEASDIISNDIIPEIDNIAIQTNKHIESLLDEVLKLQQEAKENHTELIKKKVELEKMLVLQNIISGLKVFGSVLGFLGPVGAAASSVIEIGGTLTETALFNKPGDHAEPLKQTVTGLETLQKQIQEIREQKVDNLKKSLESVYQEANKYPDTFSDITVTVSNFRSRLDRITGEEINSYQLKEVENMEIKLKTTLQKKKDSLPTTDQANDKKNNEIVAIQKMQQAVQISSAVLDAYSKHIANQAKLDAIDDAINKNEKKFLTLKQFEDEIYVTIEPMLQTIQNDVDSIVHNIDRKSTVVLDVTKWKVKSTLNNIRTQMGKLTGEFEVHDQLIQSIKMMEEAIVTLIDIHEHIRDYQKEQTFANFIADINSFTVSNNPVTNNMDLENYLKRTLNDLQITLTSSIIVQRYKVAFSAFKQFVFPFADRYLRDLVLPTHLKLDPEKGEVTLENLIFIVVNEIEKIKSKLDTYNQTIDKDDACTGYGEFTSNRTSTAPFFVWKHSEHEATISKLLLGESVTLIADITQSTRNKDKDAIKFNVINFRFKAKYKKLQSILDNRLNGFRITAVHLGNSYYRYNNKIYLMTTPIQKIWYNYEVDESREPVHKSKSYVKIKEGDIMLSPYATWKIRLDPVHDGISFDRIKAFKGDIELAGKGPYVDKISGDCEPLNVDKYYKAIDNYITESKKF